MTVRALLICNGILPGRGCRNTYRADSRSADQAREQAAVQGWSSAGWRDYCPSCTKRRQGRPS